MYRKISRAMPGQIDLGDIPVIVQIRRSFIIHGDTFLSLIVWAFS